MVQMVVKWFSVSMVQMVVQLVQWFTGLDLVQWFNGSMVQWSCGSVV